MNNKLYSNIYELINKFKGNVSICAMDTKNNMIGINENDVVETASCIKLFILIEYYRQIMNGLKNRNDEILYNYENDYVEKGSGIIQYLENNTKFSSKNMAILMMIISDNIATGKIIEYLGYDNINNTIKSLGLNNTKLLVPKLDFNKYHSIGKTTAYEYAKKYKMILDKSILTSNICNEIIEILSHQKSKEMIVKNLPLEDLYGKKDNNSVIKYIASKSGGIGDENEEIINCRNDGGIISTIYGDLIISVFINHFEDYYFYNDNPGIILGSKIIRIIYDEFKTNNNL